MSVTMRAMRAPRWSPSTTGRKTPAPEVHALGAPTSCSRSLSGTPSNLKALPSIMIETVLWGLDATSACVRVTRCPVSPMI